MEKREYNGNARNAKVSSIGIDIRFWSRYTQIKKQIDTNGVKALSGSSETYIKNLRLCRVIER